MLRCTQLLYSSSTEAQSYAGLLINNIAAIGEDNIRMMMANDLVLMLPSLSNENINFTANSH